MVGRRGPGASALPAPIASLVGAHQPGGPLARAFYTSAEVFALDMERVFGRLWLFAGHGCAIRNPGDWFTYDLGHESLIVLRDEGGAIRAFHNTCRHRGSVICAKPAGNAKRLMCPYHQWTYGLDGRLLTPIEAEFGVDRANFPLRPAPVRDVAGLIFVSLADDPVDFAPAENDIRRGLAPHGLDRAKIAKSVEYRVAANWKIVWENNRECYHCPAHHKEYNAATYDVARDLARLDPAREPAILARIAEANARFRALGLETSDVSSAMTGEYWRINRTPLMEGFVTQSLDGKPVAPLMGDFKEPDVGTLRITVFPNFWQHASGDHAVSTRLTPIGPAEMAIQVNWLVREDAVEGRDYTLDRLMPLWQRTAEQDWVICENQQRGVSSSRYVPGRYSPAREENVSHFVAWYLRQLAGPSPARAAAVA